MPPAMAIQKIRLKFDLESLAPYKGLYVSGTANGALERGVTYTAAYVGGAAFTKGVMVIAEYDGGGRLLRTAFGEQNTFSADFSASDENAAGVKIMLWEDAGTLKPLCGAASYKINQ
jgi:hypothetical protein